MSAQTDWLVGIGSTVVAGAIGIASYFTGRRQTSGSINTSAPGELWTANESLRNALSQELESMRAENAALRVEIQDARREVQAARAETEQYRQEIYAARRDKMRAEADLENALRSSDG